MKRITPPALLVAGVIALAGCGASLPPKAAHQERAITASRTPRAHASAAAKPSAHPAGVPHHQNVIIAGDSIPEDLGPMITRTLAGPLFSGHTESHPITGLVRNDYYDWPAAAGHIAAEHPDTVIMLIGGNDDQPIRLATGLAQPATPGWDAEYARRAGLVMDALIHGGVHRVYWLTMPTTDLPGMNGAVAAMGQAISTAAKSRPAVTVYSSDVLLGNDAGTRAAHQPDGIHLSILGSQLISNSLIARLRIDATL